MATRGTPPGWISRHTAAYDAERNRIVVSGGKRMVDSPSGEEYVDNPDTCALDLTILTWQQLDLLYDMDSPAESGWAFLA